MENSFETLKTLGAQRIYETTHIAKLTIEHILNKDFESLNKVQFSGFISILEREYSVDLSALRAEFEGRVNEPIKKVEQAIYAPSKSKTLQYVSMALISIVLVVIFVLTQSNTSATEESALEINNSAIDQVKDKIQEPLIDTDELIITDQELQNINNNTVQEPILPTKLIIKPNTKLWIGMVNLTTYEKTQKITKKEIELNGEDSWLIVSGHGNVDFELGDEIIKFRETKKMRLIYENGTLEKISKSEFKNRNRGKNW